MVYQQYNYVIMGNYTKIRNKIPKFQIPASKITSLSQYPSWLLEKDQDKYLALKAQGLDDATIQQRLQQSAFSYENGNMTGVTLLAEKAATNTSSQGVKTDGNSSNSEEEEEKRKKEKIRKNIAATIAAMGTDGTSGGDAAKAMAAAIDGTGSWGSFGAAAGTAAIDSMGQTYLQGRNFNDASAAGDDFANAASDIAKQFGPWGQVAAMGIQALNVADKMGGKTVPGFQVPIKSSGFGNSLKESQDQSFRLSQTGMLDNALAKRNQQAQLALQAAQVDKDNSFQLEARMASTEDVLKRNNMALAGGYGTETLGA